MNNNPDIYKDKSKYIQIAGSDIYDKIYNIYNKIPESSIFDDIHDIQKFKNFCIFLKKHTKDNKYYKLINKRHNIEKELNKSKDIKELNILLNNIKISKPNTFSLWQMEKNLIKLNNYNEDKKIKSRIFKLYDNILKQSGLGIVRDDILKMNKELGNKTANVGKDFEKKTYKIMLNTISNRLDIPINKLELLKNTILKRPNSIKDGIVKYYTIGEIDGIIINKEKKQIIAVCEVKRNLDDISGALYQIKRTYDTIRTTDDYILEHNNKQLDKSYFDYIKTLTKEQIIKGSFIFTMYDPDIQYFNISSKIFHPLIISLWSKNNNEMNNGYYNYYLKKIKKIKKKKTRYNTIHILDYFKNSGLLENVVIIS